MAEVVVEVAAEVGEDSEGDEEVIEEAVVEEEAEVVTEVVVGGQETGLAGKKLGQAIVHSSLLHLVYKHACMPTHSLASPHSLSKYQLNHIHTNVIRIFIILLRS